MKRRASTQGGRGRRAERKPNPAPKPSYRVRPRVFGQGLTLAAEDSANAAQNERSASKEDEIRTCGNEIREVSSAR